MDDSRAGVVSKKRPKDVSREKSICEFSLSID